MTAKQHVRQAAIYACDHRDVAVEAFAGDGDFTRELEREWFCRVVTNDLHKPAQYQLDAPEFLRRHLPEKVDLVDIDPYGSPWEAYEALMEQAKSRVPFVLLLTDGLAMGAKRGGYPGQGSPLMRRHLKRLGLLDELTGKFPAYSTYAYEVAARAFVIESARQEYGVRADLVVSSVNGGCHPMLYSAWRLS